MAGVKICPHCGTENDKSFVICKKCGTSLETVETVEAVSAASPESQAMPTSVAQSNSVARLLKTIAIIVYVCGFICGFLLGKDHYGDLYFPLVLPYWVVGFVCGSMFLGFAEIVRLLHEINQKK